jgi:hypothetical protein
MTTTEERTMNPTTLTGVKIVSLKRLHNSVNGNPRWLVLLDDGTEARTKPDAMLSYTIDNPEYRKVPLAVRLDGRGNIASIEVA